MSYRSVRLFMCTAMAALALAFTAQANTYHVFQGASGPDFTSVNAAFAQAIATPGDHTISIDNDNGGAGYTEPRMDLPITPLGNITITATVAVKIISSSADELFRNLSTGSTEYKLSVVGLDAANPITLYSDKAAAIVSCQDPMPVGNNGLLHLENVNLEKLTTAPNGQFLQIDSGALGQQYLKNVNFVGGVSTNTFVLMRAGSSNPATAQDIYLENVSFNQARGSTGMLILMNRVNLAAKSCTFRPLAASGNNMVCVQASSSNSGLGATGGSLAIFRDCSFQTRNNVTKDAFINLGETFQSTPNVYKLYRPRFFDCGTNIFNMADRPCEVHVLGLDDSDQPTVPRVALDTTPVSVLRYAVLRGNNKAVFRYCSATAPATNQSFGDNNGALVGNPTLELDHCNFKGTGTVIFGGSGTFEPVVNMTNCIYTVSSFSPFVSTKVVGRTGPAHVTMTHCTFTQNTSPLGFFTANANDVYTGPGSIFDGSTNAVVGAFALQSSTVPAICWNSSGQSGFTSVPGGTIVANPQLSGDGHLTTLSTPAFGAATGSSATTDIDNEARPNPVGSSPDIGADEVSAPVFVSSVTVQDGQTVRVTFAGAVGAAAQVAANYALSGSGQGTFAATPNLVSPQSTSVYDLVWNTPAEMYSGGDITVTTSNILDTNGFAMGAPLSATATAAAVGVLPQVQSIALADVSPTNAAALHYTVTFSEAVNGFGTANCALTATAGTLNGASVTDVSPASGDTYTVTVARGTGDVDIRLDVASSPAITDAALNAVAANYTAGPSYAVHELHFTLDLAAARSVLERDALSFEVALAGGVLPRTITWYFSTNVGGPFDAIDGATTETLNLAHVQLTDAGYYYVTASDANETVNSTVQHLTVEPGIPVAGLFGLAFMTAAAALTGVRAARRK